MTDLKVIKIAYKKVGIDFQIRMRGAYTYLFLVDDYDNPDDIIEGDIDLLCRTRKYLEFKNGKLASY